MLTKNTPSKIRFKIEDNHAASRKGCSNIVRIPQFTGTCWFNALLYSIFYSDGMRALLKQHMNTWDASSPIKTKQMDENVKYPSEKTRLLANLYQIFKEILTNRYEQNELTDEDMRYFQKVSPEYLLKTLHDYSPDVFRENHEVNAGGWAASYYQNFLFFLNVQQVKQFSATVDAQGNVIFTNMTPVIPNTPSANIVPDLSENDPNFVDVLLYEIRKYNNNDAEIQLEPWREVTYNNQTFVLDSVLLANYKKGQTNGYNHEIAGITCKGNRYVYNGWMLNTKDDARGNIMNIMNIFNMGIDRKNPCELFPFNWLSDAGDFCLSDINCKIHKKTDTTPLPPTQNQLCFDFTKGPRLLVYVNKRYITESNLKKNQLWRSLTLQKGPIGIPEHLNPRVLQCIKDRANVSTVSYEELFDHPGFRNVTYDVDNTQRNVLRQRAPKVFKLVHNILHCISNDKAIIGKERKHVIYSDATSKHGAKYVATALVKSGMHCALKLSRSGVLELDIKPNMYNVLLLTGKSIFGETIQVKLKKQIVSLFNERPGNIYGEKALILIIDGSYKEGLDVFDVRYMHILDNLISAADRKQVIGRAQRMCGQKGLPFTQGEGWKLEVFTYDVDIPFEKRTNYGMNDTTFQYYFQKLGNDRDALEFSSILEDVILSGAIDFELTKGIHGYGKGFQDDIGLEKPVAFCHELVPSADQNALSRIVAPDMQQGGALKNKFVQYQIEWANDPKISVCKQRPTKTFPIYSYDLIIVYLLNENVGASIPNTNRKTLCDIFSSNPSMETKLKEYIKVLSKLTDQQVIRVLTNAKELRKRRVLNSTMYYMILRRLKNKLAKPKVLSPDPDMSNYPMYRKYQKEIKQKYGFDYRWDMGVENDCDDALKATKAKKENKDVEGEGKGKGKGVMVLTPTQRFVRDYFTPQHEHKGLLLYHSVGTGKTATGIVTASTTFEKEGYRILWVTRTSLKSDVNKNIVGELSAYERIRDAMKNGEIKPGMTQQEIRLKYLSKSWRIPPMSYKQFSNALLRRNHIGEDLYRNAKHQDPLHKTLLIIDEAHKLFAEGGVSAHEQHDIHAIINAIYHSYKVSGKDSVRPLLMTATPYTNDPMEFMRIVNLLIEDESTRIPESFQQFSMKYLSEGGRFTEDGRNNFLNTLVGKVSYLNRASDIRQFAKPYFVDIHADMSTFATSSDISSVWSLKDGVKKLNTYNTQILTTTKDSIARIQTKKKEEAAVLKTVMKTKKELAKDKKLPPEQRKEMIQKTNTLIETLRKLIAKYEQDILELKKSSETVEKDITSLKTKIKFYKENVKSADTVEAGIQSCLQDILIMPKIARKPATKKPKQ